MKVTFQFFEKCTIVDRSQTVFDNLHLCSHDSYEPYQFVGIVHVWGIVHVSVLGMCGEERPKIVSGSNVELFMSESN